MIAATSKNKSNSRQALDDFEKFHEVYRLIISPIFSMAGTLDDVKRAGDGVSQKHKLNSQLG